MTSERTPLLAVVHVESRPPRYPHSTLRRFCTILLATAVFIVVLLFLIPLPHRQYLPWSAPYPESWPDSQGVSYEELQDIILKTPSEEAAREWSRYYTAGPHLAGKNLSQAIYTREKWEDFGVKSSIATYDVYINYPIDHRLALLDGQKVKYECSLKEDGLDEDPTTGLSDSVPTFHGYSASGNVTGQYVFVNFGTYQDFEDLRVANVTLEGNIALAKYGGIFRGLKVKRAEELGMIGTVIYTDPQEDGDFTETNGYKTYPDGPARNPSSVQRGSVQFLSMLDEPFADFC